MATAAVAAAPVVSTINPRQDFPAWLASHGVSLSVAEAVDRELGIGDYEAFLACAEQPHIRAELFAAARERLPFAFYAVLRRITEASSPKRHDGAGAAAAIAAAGGGGLQATGNAAAVFQPFLSGLLDAIVLMLNSLSQELLHSAERFSCLEPALYPASPDDGVANHLASDVEVVGDTSGSEVNNRSSQPHSDIQQDHSLQHAWATNGDKVERLFQNNMEDKADLPQVGDCWSAIEESPCDVEETDVNVTWREVKAERDDIVRDGETGVTDEECFSVITRTANQSTPTKLSYNGELHCVDHPHRDDAYYPYRRDGTAAADSYDAQQAWRQQQQQRLLAMTQDGHRCGSAEPADGLDDGAPAGERRADNGGGGAGRRDSPHSSAKPFGCRECGARFATKYNLRVHERRHTGERPFACEVCGRRFSRSYCLGRHKRCHVLRPVERAVAAAAAQPLR